MPIRSSFLLAVSLASLLAADKPELPPDVTEIRLWAGTAPGSELGNLPRPDFAEEWRGDAPKRSVRNATVPTLHVFRAAVGRGNGAALVVAPGGGYNTVVIEHEGWNVARRLAADGITVFVLNYRHWRRDLALYDARRALRTVRTRAAEWGVDPRRIGIGGFSAGGNLALNAATNPAASEPAPADAIDRASPRPDFLMLIYPTPVSRLPAEAVIDARFPATFVVCGVEDNADERALALASALLHVRVRHEMHVFATGAHGFGLASEIPGTGEWPSLFAAWLRTQIAPAGGLAPSTLPPGRPWGQTGKAATEPAPKR